MINIADVITRIASQTGYIVEEAKANDQELLEAGQFPKIFVGYGPIRNGHPETELTYGIIDINGENLVQSFHIKIVATVSTFRAVFISLYKALSAWNPLPEESPHTCLNYVNGEPLGINNQTFWFVSEWKINFPTNTLLN